LTPTLIAMLAFFLVAGAPDSVYAPLWAYNGSWQVTKKGAPSGSKPDNLVNNCALVGSYFACQQSVNGALSALLVFVPAKTPGQYFTQSIMPDGRAGGRGDLTIEGDKWTYLSTWNQGTKTTKFRTTNVFTGKTRIHFEQQDSSDGRDWKTTGAGDEVRTASGKMTVAR
jgi:hypothetical protein